MSRSWVGRCSVPGICQRWTCLNPTALIRSIPTTLSASSVLRSKGLNPTVLDEVDSDEITTFEEEFMAHIVS